MCNYNTIALDLEGTLISNAISIFPRPGLYAFLEFCKKQFNRIVIFTSVSKIRTDHIINILVEEGEVPNWFSDIEYVEWEGTHKDLRFVAQDNWQSVLIIDDQEVYILPEQKDNWFHIKEFESPYSDEDQEFEKMRIRLSDK